VTSFLLLMGAIARRRPGRQARRRRRIAATSLSMSLGVLRAEDGASPAGGRPGSLAGGTGVLAGSPPMSPASYPNFAGKHAGEALFTPADFAAYLRRAGALDGYRPPAGVVLCYQRSLYHHVLQAEGLKPPARQGALHGLLLLPSTGGRVGLLGQFGIGAPAAAAALEELAAMGTGAFVSVGTAGSLQRDLDIGDLVLCEAAIRDEGVSHHYLPPGKLATAQAGMTAALDE